MVKLTSAEGTQYVRIAQIQMKSAWKVMETEERPRFPILSSQQYMQRERALRREFAQEEGA